MSRRSRTIGTRWLIAVALTTACSESASRGVTGDGGGRGGSGAEGGSNAGAGGAVDGSTESGARLAVASADRNGSRVSVTLNHPELAFGFWVPWCPDQPKLLKRDASSSGWAPLRDDRPAVCAGGYYLDGNFVDNWCLGCDGGDVCTALGSPLELSTLEYFVVGRRAPPGDAGLDAGAGSVPVVEARDTSGPYALALAYVTNPSCSGPPTRETLPLP